MSRGGKITLVALAAAVGILGWFLRPWLLYMWIRRE